MGDLDESHSSSQSSELTSEIAVGGDTQNNDKQNYSVNLSNQNRNKKPNSIITPSIITNKSNNNNNNNFLSTGAANTSPLIGHPSSANNMYGSPSSRRDMYDYNPLSGGNDNNSLSNSKTPKVPCTTLAYLMTAVITCVLAIAASVYFTIKNDHNNDTITDIRAILLPLIVYIFNITCCFVFWVHSRNLQSKGYSTLFENASSISKLNFRVTSIYFVVAFAFYSFLEDKTNFVTHDDRRYIYLALYIFIYSFIGVCLARFWFIFYNHNKMKLKPDIFSSHIKGMENASNFNSSPSNLSHFNNMGDQREVIKQLINDKKTLKRQLTNVSQKLTRTQNQLRLLTNTNKNNNSNNNSIDANNYNENDVNKLLIENRKLKDDIKTERATVKSIKTEVKTIKTMLDAKNIECKQQKSMIATYESRIQTLTLEKEKLENEINQGYDQKEDILVLYQVKEEEVKIAQMENKRLRNKLAIYQNSDKEQLLNDIQKLRKKIEQLKQQ